MRREGMIMNKTLARIISGMIPNRRLRRLVRDNLRGTETGRTEGVVNMLSEYPLIVSYAQFAEDIVLYKYLHYIENGFYVDVGAADPIHLSVTKLFYDRSWSGINIEPRHDAINLYRESRPRDINLAIGVSDHQGTAEFYVSGENSTLDVEGAQRQGFDNATTIKLDLLGNILSEYAKPEIHFLKIDVENHEKEVLGGMDFSRFRPWIIAMESTIPDTDLANYNQWESVLLNNKYSLLTRHHINRYYVAEEKKGELVGKALKKIHYIQINDYKKLIAE